MTGHKLLGHGPAGYLSRWQWKCECGKWSSDTPARGPWGRTTAKAIIAQINMAHAKHVKGTKR